MIKRIKLTLLLFFVMLITNCNSGPTQGVILTVTESLVTPVTPSVTAANQPQPTITPNIEIAKPFTPVKTPTYRITQDCLKSLPEIHSNPEPAGMIVMSGEDMNKPTYTLDLSSGEKIMFADEKTRITGVAVSLDGRWVAYQSEGLDGGDSKLEILSAAGDIHESIQWGNSWRMISGWLASDQLLISNSRAENPYFQNDSIIVIDPVTQESVELPAEYPDLMNEYPGTNWPGFWAAATIYDSSLSRVLYPSGSNQLVLRDLALNQEISKVVGTVSSMVSPQWSWDDQNIAIVGPANLLGAPNQSEADTTKQEIFLISRDGNIDQMTDFANQFDETLISNIAWSPDNQNIAFSFISIPGGDSGTEDRRGRFAILNTKTHEVIDYCFSSHTPGKPIWSPDGKFVVVENRLAEINQNEVFLIDLDRKTATKIDENIAPVGWLK